MTCCGEIIEITTHDHWEPIFLCTECGKQGPQDSFPDPPPPEPAPLSWREKAANALHRIAQRISQ